MYVQLLTVGSVYLVCAQTWRCGGERQHGHRVYVGEGGVQLGLLAHLLLVPHRTTHFEEPRIQLSLKLIVSYAVEGFDNDGHKQ